MYNNYKTLINSYSELGEGIIYDPIYDSLYWVDILGAKLFRYILRNKKLTMLQTDLKYPSIIFPASTGENIFIVASHHSLYLYNVDTNSVIKELCSLPESYTEESIRFNDGKLDRDGNLWIGTMDLYNRPNKGGLFKMIEKNNEAGEDRLVLVKVTLLNLAGKEIQVSLSNGMGWSKNGNLLYYIDTPTKEVKIFAIAKNSESILQQISTIDLKGYKGSPDGMTIDPQSGYLYIAMWEGSQILVIDPLNDDGLITTIELPVSCPTSCTIGKNNTLYITTAKVLGEEDSGSVFIYNLQFDATPQEITKLKF